MDKEYKVSLYNLKTAKGVHIRVATQVKLPSGKLVKFMDKMTKKEAIKEAKRYEKNQKK